MVGRLLGVELLLAGDQQERGGLSRALESGGNVLHTLFPLIGQYGLWRRWDLKRKDFHRFKERKETTLLFQSKMLGLPRLGMVEADKWMRDSRCHLGMVQVTGQNLPPGLGKRRHQGVDSLGDSEGPKAREWGWGDLGDMSHATVQSSCNRSRERLKMLAVPVCGQQTWKKNGREVAKISHRVSNRVSVLGHQGVNSDPTIYILSSYTPLPKIQSGMPFPDHGEGYGH